MGSSSEKCTFAFLCIISCALTSVSTSPVPVGGVSNVGFSIYPAGSPAHHQTMHSTSFSNKVLVNYDVRHPPNPNPGYQWQRKGFKSQQNHYAPPAPPPPAQEQRTFQHDWRRQEQHRQPPPPPPQNWMVPEHVPSHERPQPFNDMSRSEFLAHREQQQPQKRKPRPIFLDEVQQWEDPNIGSHRRWNQERQAVLNGGARNVHQTKDTKKNIMAALDESAPLEYF